MKLNQRGGPFFALFTLVCVLGSVCNSNAQKLIDIDTINYVQDPLKVGLAATGVATNDFWNDYYMVSVNAGALPNLKYADGTVSGAGLTVLNGPGFWFNGAADPMFRDYEYNQGGNITLTVTNLPAGKYDIYVYGHGPIDAAQSVFSVTAGSVSYGTNSTVQGPGWNTNVWQEGEQYVVFRGVQITNSGHALTVVVYPGSTGYSIISGMQIVPNYGAAGTPPNGATTLFFDDFNGPNLNPIWQAYLPGAHIGVISDMITYQGAPNYAFAMLDTNTVLRLTNTLSPLHRVGWSSASNFTPADFHYEARFNTLNQSPSNSVDGFMEIWILDAADTNRYDIVSLFGGANSTDRRFFAGSSIDNFYQSPSFNYSNNTYYRLVLEAPPGQNIRASLRGDDGAELIGATLNHGASAFPSGFKICLSQAIGIPFNPSPVDVAVDFVDLRTTGLSGPSIVTQPTNQTVAAGANASFSVVANGSTPLSYQWKFNGTNLAGAMSSALTISNAQPANAGSYSVVITNAYGSITSSNATLVVNNNARTTLFFDDFNGPHLSPIWQASLPNAHIGVISDIVTYEGAPNYGFAMLDTNTVLRLTNTLSPLQRVGWSSVSNFTAADFHYEARFNTLNQSPSNSIDGFMEIWILDAANSNRYDIVSLFGGSYSADRRFFAGSSIDNSYQSPSFGYQNNTYYRLVLDAPPGQNIRASLHGDDGTELIGVTLNHGASAFQSGFKICLSQAIGIPYNPAPVDVAVDYVSLTSGGESGPKQSIVQIVNTTASAGMVVLPINLVAVGSENGLGFSVNFDPSRLTFNSVALGSGATGGSLISNTSQTSSGHLGLLISLPSGASFAASTQQVARITFSAAQLNGGTNTSTVTAVSFGDQPIARQVVNAQAAVLPATYVNGNVTIPLPGYEGDVAPLPNGDGRVTVTDWVQVGRFVAGLDPVPNPGEFQRADCAPRSTLGDGLLTVADWVQAGRYAAGLDPLTVAGGPSQASLPHLMAAATGTKSGPLGASAVSTVTVVSGNAQPGRPCQVSVQLNSQGDENALGFSLNFNASALNFTGATLGSGAAGATFNVNARGAASGQIGIALALPVGATFPASMQELVKLNFTVAPSASGSAAISFVNTPVIQEVSDATASTVSATYVSGAVNINSVASVPVMHVTSANGALNLSWPASAAGFGVEASTNLINWTPVTGTMVTNGANVTITAPAGGPQMFYRLQHP